MTTPDPDSPLEVFKRLVPEGLQHYLTDVGDGDPEWYATASVTDLLADFALYLQVMCSVLTTDPTTITNQGTPQ